MAERARLPQAEALPFDGDLPDQVSRPSLREWTEYALHAARRYPWRLVAVFVAGLCVTTLIFELKTPLYRAETKVLTQRQQAMPSISRSAMSDEAPTRTANDLIRRRNNLVALLERAGALPKEGVSAPASGLQRILNMGAPPASGEDAVNAMVLNLDRALTVTTGDGTVTISVDWPEPQQAYSFVQEALQNFLESRQIQEITAIDETITLLHGRTAELRSQLETTIRDAQRNLPRGPDVAASPTPRTPPLPAQPSEALARLRASVEATSRSIRDLEDLRSRRMAELQGQLNERRSVFSDAHPTVIALKGEIASLSHESRQLVTLREEEARLQDEYRARLAAEVPRASSSGPVRLGSGLSQLSAAAAAASVNEDERVRDARFRYTQMVDRLNAAQLELDSARAAFKHRYSVLWPAQVPSKPVSPSPLKVFGLGTVLSLMLALAAVTVPDLRAGRIMERSQVERSLGIPVLASIRRE
jgi:uncharacterized protein involved in exopolysaccharide biosynthesis